jgi:hypothetical protein
VHAVAGSGQAAIERLLQDYFDGLHRSDSALLREVLHPSALYATASSGELRCLRMDEYWPVIDARPSPASQGEPRSGRIVALEFAGPATALARVECAIPPKRYLDLLTLLKVDGRWWIIAKVFHYELAGTGLGSPVKSA